MIGLRGLWNFGWGRLQEVGIGEGGSNLLGTLTGVGKSAPGSSEDVDVTNEERVDEEERMEGGLRGRFSAGGEVYFSAKQRSFGSKFIALQPVPFSLPILLVLSLPIPASSRSAETAFYSILLCRIMLIRTSINRTSIHDYTNPITYT